MDMTLLAHPPGPSRMLRCGMLALGLVVCASGAALAQGEPPITSARDAACRDEARNKVFSTPDPQNLGLRAVGRQIYTACMKRGASRSAGPRRHRHHRRR